MAPQSQTTGHSDKLPRRKVRRGPAVRSIVEAAMAAGATVTLAQGTLTVIPRPSAMADQRGPLPPETPSGASTLR
jgi:hypothetical protein